LLLLKELSKMEADVVAAMDDDLDAPKALQILSSFLRNTRAYVKSRSSLARSTCESALGRLRTLTDILGILVDQ
jgi:cysteinyl-tRNA synthetase